MNPINQERMTAALAEDADNLKQRLAAMMLSVKDEKRLDVAREKIEAQGGVFDVTGKQFTIPGCPLTFNLTGPKGDTKLTRQQRRLRDRERTARKDRAKARRKGR